jgi:hypothetical protein
MNPILTFLLFLCFLPSLKAEEKTSERNPSVYLIITHAVEKKGVMTCSIMVPKLPLNTSDKSDLTVEHLKKAWIKGGSFSIPLNCPTPSQGGNIVFSLPTASLEGMTLQLDINRNGSKDRKEIIKLLGFAKGLADVVGNDFGQNNHLSPRKDLLQWHGG